MDSWRPRLPWNNSEAQKVDCNNFVEKTADGFLLNQNPNILDRRPKSSLRSDELQDNSVWGQKNVRKHRLKIDWKQSNQLIERKRPEAYGNPRGFEAMRVLNSSWKTWRQRREISEGSGDDQINESETTPNFKVLASAKPLCNAPKINQEMKKKSSFSIKKPRALKQVMKTLGFSKTENVSCVTRQSTRATSDESSESTEDTPSADEVKPVATLDKALNSSSRRDDRSLYPALILQWLEENHEVLDDFLTRIDKNEQGGLSYEEFVQELQDMGAPGTQDDLHIMAFALDTNEDHLINYKEVKKLKRRFRGSSFVNNNEFMNQRYETLPVLRPCSKCKIGLFEPTQPRIRRFIRLVVKNFIIRGTQRNSLIGQFTFNVGPDISIYGIQRMVKAELGGLAIAVQVLRGINRKVEVLDHMKTLEDYGYRGSTVMDRPEVVVLFYDYDYPRLDCPLLFANSSV